MPIPKPNKGEEEQDFISRCMGNDTMVEEYPDQKQRSAICYDTWRSKDKDKTKASKDEPETYDINNVEIAAAGTWDASTGKLKITEENIDEMITAYNELTAKGQSNIPIKLGHDDNQKLLQKDGYPSAGWVVNLRKKADKMLGDFKAIPKVVHKIIMGKGYTSVSPEIYKNYKDTNNNRVYKCLLNAVALLGKEHKAMTTLKDLVSVYSQEDNAQIEMVFSMESPVIKEFTKEDNMEEVEKLTKERDEIKAELEKVKAERESAKTEIEKFSKDLNEANEKLEKNKMDSHKAKIDAFIEKNTTEGKILKSQEEAYRALFDNVEKDKVIKFSIGEEEKEGNAFDLIESIVESNPNLVELNEFSRETEDDDIDAGEKKDSNDIPLEDTKEAAKLAKFMKENKITDAREGYKRAREEEVL